jgi:hypothetical protein
VLRSAPRISIEAQNGFCNSAARNGYSDNDKFSNDLNRPKKTENVRTALETTTKFSDLQSEYELSKGISMKRGDAVQEISLPRQHGRSISMATRRVAVFTRRGFAGRPASVAGWVARRRASFTFK